MHPAIIIGTVRSLIVDVAMGQIPRSTERISSYYYYMIYIAPISRIELEAVGGKLVLITNTKSYMSFRLVLKFMTLNDLERCNGSYFA